MKTQATRNGLVLAAILMAASPALAQQTTERYIPIGASPGISGEESVIGTISAVDYESKTMRIDGPDGTVSVTMDDGTWYFIDRSASKRSNRSGELESCETGMRVEAYVGDDGKVVWVKIASAE